MAGAPRPYIALIGRDARRIQGMLQGHPGAPRVVVLEEFYGAVQTLLASPPSSLWLDADPLVEEDLGALRLLRTAMPGLVLVLIARSWSLPRARRFAGIVGAAVLARPFGSEQVAALLGPLPGGHGETPLQVRDVVRGLADEIGSPLLYASGYLQILAHALDRARDPETAEKLDMVRGGIDRIGRSIQKLRMLVEPLRPVPARVPLGRLLKECVDKNLKAAGTRGVRVTAAVDPRPGAAELLLDPEATGSALDLILRACVDLADPGSTVAATARLMEASMSLVLDVTAAGARSIPLERVFDPYALSGLLASPDSGLNLALARNLLSVQGASLAAGRPAHDVLRLQALLPLAPPPDG